MVLWWSFSLFSVILKNIETINVLLEYESIVYYTLKRLKLTFLKVSSVLVLQEYYIYDCYF